MAKKKQMEVAPPKAEASISVAETRANDAPASMAPDELGGLAQDVEAFLSQRDQLRQRLAEEIAATEKKLEELKRTAAMLFPEKEPAPLSPKDRKGKGAGQGKPAKRKATPAPPESSAETPAEESPGDESPIQEGAPHEPHLD